MRCAHCDRETEARPCGHCGLEPWVGGRYELKTVLGRGNSGTTWAAIDHQRDERVAIKEIPLRAGDDDPIAILERRGADLLRQLRHPNVPAWRDTLVEGHGKARSLYVVQELVDGLTLEAELVDRRYDAVEALKLADEVLGILAYLHGLSPPVVHRDLKPSNLIRRPDGRLVLIDFGSVRDALRDTLVGGHTVTGTFGYMAPEQFAGDATPASDLYGLGATLVHLLSRVPPAKMLGPDGRLDWERQVSIPEPVRDVLRNLIQADPARRYASAELARVQVRAALARLGRPQAELVAAGPRAGLSLEPGPRLAEATAAPELKLPAPPDQVPARAPAGGLAPGPFRKTSTGVLLISWLVGMGVGLLFVLLALTVLFRFAIPSPKAEREGGEAPAPVERVPPAEIPAPEDRTNVAQRFSVPPPYPKEAMGGAYGDSVECTFPLAVDTEGNATLAGPVADCPAPFRESFESVLSRWRYWPALDSNGQPVAAPYTLKIKWKRKNSSGRKSTLSDETAPEPPPGG